MKRTILALAFAGALLCAWGGSAQAGQTTYRIETSTPVDTAVLLQSGVGVLYAVECSSGATTSYALAFDASSTAGISVLTLGKAITPQVYSSGTSFVAQAGYGPSRDIGTTFFNGLVGITHGGTINCLFKVGPNQGSIP